MPYNYHLEKPELFTDQGQRLFLKIRDKVFYHIEESGAVRGDKATGGLAGSSWTMLACLDRMVEIGEIVRLNSDDLYGERQVYVRA